jgi:hypothetical protein
LFVRTDVAREDDIVEKTMATFGALQIAFNNAGTEAQFGLLTTEQTVEHYQVCDITSDAPGVLLPARRGGTVGLLKDLFSALFHWGARADSLAATEACGEGSWLSFFRRLV